MDTPLEKTDYLLPEGSVADSVLVKGIFFVFLVFVLFSLLYFVRFYSVLESREGEKKDIRSDDRKLGRTWEELGKGKKHDQNILSLKNITSPPSTCDTILDQH